MQKMEDNIMSSINERMQIIMPEITSYMQKNPFRFIPEDVLLKMAISDDVEH